MLHRDALQLLMPIDLGGEAPRDLETEGRHLDVAQASAEQLIREMFADSAADIVAWERVLAIAPASDATRTERVNEILYRLRTLGRLDRQYFIGIAATVGYEITITELHPLMAGWGEAGHEVMSQEVWWIWQVTIADGFTQYARAGRAAAGDPLEWYRDDRHLKEIFEDLKPAHTMVIFV